MSPDLAILVVLGPNPSPLTGRGTNTYVVGRGPALVIDPGPHDDAHLDRVEAAVWERGGAAAVVLTHHHLDHSQGGAEMANRLGAPLAAFPHPASALVEQNLAEGLELRFGGGALRVVHTPGHTRDHVCLWSPSTQTAFVGDLVAGEGYIVIDPPEGDMSDYLDSLRKVRELGARSLRPGHGPPIASPAAYLDAYLSHRLEREAKALAALGDEPRTAAELLPIVYADTDARMHPVAARSLVAHLQKLARDGLLVVDDGGAEPAYRLSA